MDVVSLWTWRGVYDRRMLRDMLPGAMLGIGIGWLTAALVTGEMVRLIVGAVAIVFVGALALSAASPRLRAMPRRRIAPSPAFWGIVAGFTSFVAHVGGPPFQVYALPLAARSQGLHRHQRRSSSPSPMR